MWEIKKKIIYQNEHDIYNNMNLRICDIYRKIEHNVVYNFKSIY